MKKHAKRKNENAKILNSALPSMSSGNMVAEKLLGQRQDILKRREVENGTLLGHLLVLKRTSISYADNSTF